MITASQDRAGRKRTRTRPTPALYGAHKTSALAAGRARPPEWPKAGFGPPCKPNTLADKTADGQDQRLDFPEFRDHRMARRASVPSPASVDRRSWQPATTGPQNGEADFAPDRSRRGFRQYRRYRRHVERTAPYARTTRSPLLGNAQTGDGRDGMIMVVYGRDRNVRRRQGSGWTLRAFG